MEIQNNNNPKNAPLKGKGAGLGLTTRLGLKHSILLLLLLFGLHGYSQDAESLVSKMRQKFGYCQSYTVQAKIKPDITFLKMLPVNATIYFKQKNKYRIKSKGLAILPKQGSNLMMNLLNDEKSYQKLLMGKAKIGNTECQIVKMIPNSDTGDVILATFYIDEKNVLLNRVQLTTKTMGTIQGDFIYGKYAQYLLPDSSIFTMDIRKFKIPRAVAGDLENSGKKKPANHNSKTGKITIVYKDYKINTPIDDKIFKEKE